MLSSRLRSRLCPGAVIVAALVAAPTGADAAPWSGIAANRNAAGSSYRYTGFDAQSGAVLGSTSFVAEGDPRPRASRAVAITPDGRAAWSVTALEAGTPAGGPSGKGTLRRIDLTTANPGVSAAVDIPGATAVTVCAGAAMGTGAIALSPSGNAAYVASYADSKLWTIGVAGESPVFGSAISLPAGSLPTGIAIDPAGTTAYVAAQGGDAVIPVSLETAAVGDPIALPAGSKPSALAITPDGRELWVGLSAGGSVVPISLPARTVGTPIAVQGSPSGVAISPGGDRAYVTGGGGEPRCPGATPAANKVTPVDIAARTAQAALTLPGGAASTFPTSPALTPDGRRLFVATESSLSDRSYGFDVSGAAGPLLTPDTGFWNRAIAITPDQAPTAAFSASGTLAGAPVAFDGGLSTAPTGTIARYDWDFGDGATATTSGPTTSHTYLTPGAKSATLKVTTTGGTSTERVFTGQALLRNGGPSAQTGRSFTLSESGAAVPRWAPATVEFGNAAPGDAQTAPATLSNVGDRPAVVSSLSIEGADAGAFAITADGCAGQTLAPGATCTAGLRFTPTRPDATLQAQLVANTDGPQPRTPVTLSGTSNLAIAISGTIRNATAGEAPLAGARVSLCRSGDDRLGCLTVTTAADGRYAFGGRAPGAYRVEVSPPGIGSALFPASAELTPRPGTSTVRDFSLRAPERLPSTFEVASSYGSQKGGTPQVNWDSPFSLRVPANIAPTGAANTSKLHLYVMQLGPDPGAGARPAATLVSVVAFQVAYGDDGQLEAFSQVAEGIGGTALLGTRAGATRQARGVTQLGQRLQASGCGVGDGQISFTPSAGGGVQLNIGWIEPLSISFDPITVQPPAPTGNRGLDIAAARLAGAADNWLGAQPSFAAYNTLVRIANVAMYVRNRRYAAAARQATVNWGLPALGERIGGSEGFHGAVSTQVTSIVTDSVTANTESMVSAATSAVCNHQSGNLYIDPSGHVVTKKGAVPLEGAKVVLQRSETAAGPFTQVPDGDTIMSPGNRVNPDRTDVTGHFGWDVIPGFYRVDASLKGCKARTSSRIMEIPPPVTDLLLRLDCKAPKRTAVTLKARQLRSAKGRAATGTVPVYEATVRSRRGKPVGVVTFRRGKKVVGAASVDPRGTARVTGTAKGKGRVSVSYGGSARHAAGRGTVR